MYKILREEVRETIMPRPAWWIDSSGDWHTYEEPVRLETLLAFVGAIAIIAFVWSLFI